VDSVRLASVVSANDVGMLQSPHRLHLAIEASQPNALSNFRRLRFSGVSLGGPSQRIAGEEQWIESTIKPLAYRRTVMSVCIKSSLVHVLRAAVLPMLLLGVLSSTTFAQGQLSVSLTQKECFDAINQARAEYGLYPLKASTILFGTAQRYAEWMANQNMYGHNLDGTTPSEKANAAGYPKESHVGECLCFFRGEPTGTPEQNAKDLARGAVAQWLGSTMGHREAVLHGTKQDMGIGFATKGDRFYFCFHQGQKSAETDNPPQLVVVGGNESRPALLPVRVNSLRASELAGEWDWVGFSSKLTLRADGENLIWKDQTGEYTLMKLAGEASTFQFSNGAKARFTSKDAADFFGIDGTNTGRLRRTAPTAIDPTGNWSYLDGSNPFQLKVVAGGLIHTQNGHESMLEKVADQPNSYRFKDIGIVIAFSSNDAATIASFGRPIELKRQ
jgi:uncharacterized protein YkwD